MDDLKQMGLELERVAAEKGAVQQTMERELEALQQARAPTPVTVRLQSTIDCL